MRTFKFKSCFALVVGAVFLSIALPSYAQQGPRLRTVLPFVKLPAGSARPEGLAADASGRIFVGLAFQRVIHVYGPDKILQTTITLPTGVGLLGLQFDPAGNLWAADVVHGSVLKLSPPFSADSVPAATISVCGGFGAGCALNGIAFDASGNLYVSDGPGGQIFKVDLPGGTVSTFVADELLKPPPQPHGFPHLGANGLAFDAAGTALYIANTADDRILKLDLESMTLSTFAESLNGADGIAFDPAGRLWVACNQADEVVALNSSGGVAYIARLFYPTRIGPDGAPRGLLFPASPVISGGYIYVTNLAVAFTPKVGDELEEKVTTWTVSRIRLP